MSARFWVPLPRDEDEENDHGHGHSLIFLSFPPFFATLFVCLSVSGSSYSIILTPVLRCSGISFGGGGRVCVTVGVHKDSDSRTSRPRIECRVQSESYM